MGGGGGGGGGGQGGAGGGGGVIYSFHFPRYMAASPPKVNDIDLYYHL